MNAREALAALGLPEGASTDEIEARCTRVARGLRRKLAAATEEAERTRLQRRLDRLEVVREAALSLSAPPAFRASEMRDMGGVAPSFTVGVGGASSVGRSATQGQLGIGEVLAGRYEVRGRIGSGGMGEVYRAFDRTRREEVALKVMLPAFMQDEEAQERFRAEAHLTSKLSHPNIVRVYDVQEQDGRLFLSMELLRGKTVRELTERRKSLPVSQVLDIGIQLCNALSYAHRRTVHRDIKPENLWIEEDGNLKLMDFGIAKTVSATQFTMAGMSLGTAYYMSPEQLKGEANIDARADQFAVAVVLYEMLTGQVPIGRAKQLAHVRKDVPGGMSAAIDRALSAKKADRFPNMVEFAKALRSKVSSRAQSLLAVGALSVAVLAMGGVVFKDQISAILSSSADEGGASATERSTTTGAKARVGSGDLGALLSDPSSSIAAIRMAWKPLENLEFVDLEDPEAAISHAVGVARRYLEAKEPLRAHRVLQSASRWRPGEALAPLFRRVATTVKARLRKSLKIVTPVENAEITEETFSVRGMVLDSTVVQSVQVGDRAKARIDGDQFSASVSGIDDGARPIRIVANADIQIDGKPLSHAFTLFIVKDTAPPVIRCEVPKGTVHEATVSLVGCVEDATQVVLHLGADEISLHRNGAEYSFRHKVNVKHGKNDLELMAVDAVGHRSRFPIVFRADLRGAEVTVFPRKPTSKAESKISGTTEPGSTVTIDGERVPVDSNGRFAFDVKLKKEGKNQFRIQATSATGKLGTQKTITLVRDTRGPSISLDTARWTGVRMGRIEVPLRVHDLSPWRLRVGKGDWTDWQAAARGEVEISLQSPLPLTSVEVIAEDRLGNKTPLQSVALSDKAALPAGLTPKGKNRRGFEEFRAESAPGFTFIRIPAMRIRAGPGKWTTVLPFFIGKHEVSERAFLKQASKLGLRRPKQNGMGYFDASRRSEWPIVNLTLEDAKRFCESLGCRLPSTLEWEAVSLAGRSGAAPWGESSKPSRKFKSQANIGAKWQGKAMREAGYPVFRPTTLGFESACGCIHLYGNASELLSDGNSAGWSAVDRVPTKWPARFGVRRAPDEWVGVRLVLDP